MIQIFANRLVEVVEKSTDMMGFMAESVKFIAKGMKIVKDFYDDLRAIADELMKMDDYTLKERNKASQLLIHNPPLVHLFRGF